MRYGPIASSSVAVQHVDVLVDMGAQFSIPGYMTQTYQTYESNLPYALRCVSFIRLPTVCGEFSSPCD